MHTTIADLNRQHEEFWNKRNKGLAKLLSRSYVVNRAAAVEREKARWLGEARDQEDRLNRLRAMRPFELELESIDEELAPRRLQLAQQERARRPRGRVTANGLTIGQIISSIALCQEHRNKSAKQLWPLFIEVIRARNLKPEVEEHALTRQGTCHYTFRDGRKHITEGQFRNVVSQTRRRAKKNFSA
jgi:hypothetical protein